MTVPYQRCEDLKSRIDKYCTPDMNSTLFLKDLCRPDAAYTANQARDEQAYELLYETLAADELSLDRILHIHNMLFSDSENAGVLRQKRVFAGSNRAPIPAPDVLRPLMDGFIRTYNNPDPKVHPIYFAAVIHQKFAFLYPFLCGTLEMAQFMQNLVLLKNGYPPALIPEEKRAEYKSLLDDGRLALDRFAQFIADRVAEAEEAVLEKIEASDLYVLPAPDREAASAASPVPQKIETRPNGRVFLIDDTADSPAVPENPVYARIAAEPGIRKTKLVKELGMQPSAVAKELARLKKAGLIEFKGLPSSGGYVTTAGRSLKEYFG